MAPNDWTTAHKCDWLPLKRRRPVRYALSPVVAPVDVEADMAARLTARAIAEVPQMPEDVNEVGVT